MKYTYIRLSSISVLVLSNGTLPPLFIVTLTQDMISFEKWRQEGGQTACVTLVQPAVPTFVNANVSLSHHQHLRTNVGSAD